MAKTLPQKPKPKQLLPLLLILLIAAAVLFGVVMTANRVGSSASTSPNAPASEPQAAGKCKKDADCNGGKCVSNKCQKATGVCNNKNCPSPCFSCDKGGSCNKVSNATSCLSQQEKDALKLDAKNEAQAAKADKAAEEADKAAAIKATKDAATADALSEAAAQKANKAAAAADAAAQRAAAAADAAAQRAADAAAAKAQSLAQKAAADAAAKDAAAAAAQKAAALRLYNNSETCGDCISNSSGTKQRCVTRKNGVVISSVYKNC